MPGRRRQRHASTPEERAEFRESLFRSIGQRYEKAVSKAQKPPVPTKDSPVANWSVFLAIAVPAAIVALIFMVTVMKERPGALLPLLFFVSIAAGALGIMFYHITGRKTADWANYDRAGVRWFTGTGGVIALILAGGGVLMAISAILQSATN